MAVVSVAYARDMVANNSRYKDSEKWKKKVDSMPSWQIMAIYYRMLHSGEFDTEKRPKEEPGSKEYVQLTLFDFGLEVENGLGNK